MGEPIENLCFFELFLLCAFVGDGLGKIAALSVLHDDFEFILLGGVDFDEAHDEWMLEVAQDLGLLYGFLLLLLTHVVDAHFLYHKQFSRLLLPHQVGLPKGSLPQQFLLLVYFVFCL